MLLFKKNLRDVKDIAATAALRSSLAIRKQLNSRFLRRLAATLTGVEEHKKRIPPKYYIFFFQIIFSALMIMDKKKKKKKKPKVTLIKTITSLCCSYQNPPARKLCTHCHKYCIFLQAFGNYFLAGFDGFDNSPGQAGIGFLFSEVHILGKKIKKHVKKNT